MKIFTALFSIAILFSACSDATVLNIKSEKQRILDLHNQQRDFHFNKDSIRFADLLASNHISMNHGEINTPSRRENISIFHNYFSAVEFIRWDDVSTPIIKFSDDGSMAYTVVDKIVELEYKGEDGEAIRDTTHYAWSAIYRHYEDGWKIDCVTSTNL